MIKILNLKPVLKARDRSLNTTDIIGGPAACQKNNVEQSIKKIKTTPSNLKGNRDTNQYKLYQGTLNKKNI